MGNDHCHDSDTSFEFLTFGNLTHENSNPRQRDGAMISSGTVMAAASTVRAERKSPPPRLPDPQSPALGPNPEHKATRDSRRFFFLIISAGLLDLREPEI